MVTVVAEVVVVEAEVHQEVVQGAAVEVREEEEGLVQRVDSRPLSYV